MADPKVLYAVVSVVFAGLMVWLAFVFRTAKEPWAAAPLAVVPVAKAEPAPAVVAEEDADDEDEEDEEDDADDEEGQKVTVKNEVATEEAIEKAKKA
jgi:hypothetical protein